jgi:hypothetical protein
MSHDQPGIAVNAAGQQNSGRVTERLLGGDEQFAVHRAGEIALLRGRHEEPDPTVELLLDRRPNSPLARKAARQYSFHCQLSASLHCAGPDLPSGPAISLWSGDKSRGGALIRLAIERAPQPILDFSLKTPQRLLGSILNLLPQLSIKA